MVINERGNEEKEKRISITFLIMYIILQWTWCIRNRIFDLTVACIWPHPVIMRSENNNRKFTFHFNDIVHTMWFYVKKLMLLNEKAECELKL